MKTLLVLTFLLSVGLAVAQQSPEQTLDYRHALSVALKTANVIPDDNETAAYIHDYCRSVYDQSKDNEFEWHDKLEQYRNELIKARDSVNLAGEYRIIVGVKFGDYDFEKGGFPLDLKPGQYYRLQPEKTDWTRKSKEVDIMLSNADELNFFKIDKEKAKELVSRVNSQKDDSGNVTREVRVVFHYKAVDASDDAYQLIRSRYTPENYLVVGKIDRVEILN